MHEININVYLFREEAIQKSGMPTMKNGTDMEQHVYSKAKSKVFFRRSLQALQKIERYNVFLRVSGGISGVRRQTDFTRSRNE